ncbi:Slam-dependent surface lipoprotein [Actinobacillus pleuropneumoniae]|uniref:Slam-dependent surface lipoprotein n=2 Tax=Actinobacillus pleuropneumoniae TaxID=715 RepID=UPI0020790BAF|nr:Slam-dependent surface lipoprotein [Actinobacillus pleuropneumoniae]
MKNITKFAVTLLAGLVITACGSKNHSIDIKPKSDKPKQEQPKQPQPKQDQPKQEQPKQEQPKQEQPKQEQPKQEQPKQEQPKQDHPKHEQPKQEQPKQDQPKQEQPKQDQPKQDQPKQDQPKQDQPKQEQPKQDQPKDKTSGGVFIVEGVSKNLPQLTKEKLTDANLNSIKVDGIEIKFADATKAEGNWKVSPDNSLVVCCDKYSSVRFGVYESKGKSYSFYNGNATAEMPTSGKFTYTGDAYLLASVVGNGAESIGTSKFEADFGTKKLTGTLTFDKLKDSKNVDIDSKISGNSFTGKATFDSFKGTDAIVEGKFYGENAKELAGAFDSAKEKGAKLGDKSWGGVFGAKQQK